MEHRLFTFNTQLSNSEITCSNVFRQFKIENIKKKKIV